MILIIIVAVFIGSSCSKAKPTLYIFNWSDYIDPELIKAFQDEYNCKVKYSTYDSNENMLTKVMSSRESFDLLFPSGDHVSILMQSDLLEPLDKEKITNYTNLDPELLQKAQSFDPENRYSVPYFWGLTGLLYNKQYVPENIIAQGGWNIIADAFFEGKNKVTMLDDAREVVGAAMVFSGFSLNDTSEEALQAATEALKVWDRNITQFDSDSYKNEVADGTTWLAQAYNGDALQQMVINPNLGFILPKEGTSMWMDNIVLLKSSKNKELAYKFIDFLLDAENGRINAEYTQYPSPNRFSMEMMSAEFKNNPTINPGDEYLDKCYMIEFIGDDVKKIDAIYEQIKLN
jgi:spermidine/putrescine transport system substrate-binding protein